jgi:hypothetical protein
MEVGGVVLGVEVTNAALNVAQLATLGFLIRELRTLGEVYAHSGRDRHGR